MNGSLLIITHFFKLWCVTKYFTFTFTRVFDSFWLKKIVLNNFQKNMHFRDQKFKLEERGLPIPQWERGGSPSDATYSARASI